MGQIFVNGLSFGYDGGEEIFSGLTLNIDARHRLGLIGRNGRGKTTFFRLLSGELDCGGAISLGGLRVLRFPFAVDETKTVAEFARENTVAEDWELLIELGRLECDVADRRFGELSMGERTKAMLAVLFLSDGFMLIDEPTNHLDAHGREVVAAYLSGKRGFILISHDAGLLDACTTHTLAINRKSIELVGCAAGEYLANKERQNRHEQAENVRLKRDIARLAVAAERATRHSDGIERTKFGSGVSDRGFVGAKAARMMQSAKNLERRIGRAAEEKAGLLHDIEGEFELQMNYRPLSGALVDLRDVEAVVGDRVLFSGLDFRVEAGERISLQGVNGSGKSTLCKIVAGVVACESREVPGRVFGRDGAEGRTSVEALRVRGEVARAERVRVSYLAQDVSGLSGSVGDFCREFGLDDVVFRAVLNKLGVDGGIDLAAMSDGARKKVAIARSLCEEASLYVWDEPFNYVDIFARRQILRLLEKVKPTMVLIEHDRSLGVGAREVRLDEVKK